ncbi:hypothetical protein Daudx_0377 [Candidatus Desulforudis audaxviator]|nr:hypothetical protein Daudx_0377 [Candidatus Desulforudis audaxviator]
METRLGTGSPGDWLLFPEHQAFVFRYNLLPEKGACPPFPLFPGSGARGVSFSYSMFWG